ncbi:MAG TPA: hypothetical protein VGO58_07070 [Chitinophagaceae bacterium]|jgi:hypothetical protein|nr:hypothetical protein [Chitinophagaceae bacterium]
MKKFLAIVAIASLTVACNNSGEKTETADTATKVVGGDTVTKVTTTDTTVKNEGDTTIKKEVTTDTAKKSN